MDFNKLFSFLALYKTDNQYVIFVQKVPIILYRGVIQSIYFANKNVVKKFSPMDGRLWSFFKKEANKSNQHSHF